MTVYEKTIIFTSTMTEEELLAYKDVDVSEDLSLYAQGRCNKEYLLKQIRTKIKEKLNKDERVRLWAGPVTLKEQNISEIPFYENDVYKKRFALFVQHMKNMTCPSCGKTIWLNANKGFVSCRGWPNCQFTVNRRVYDEIMRNLKDFRE